MGELIVWLIITLAGFIGLVLVLAAIGVAVWVLGYLFMFALGMAATGAVAVGAAGYVFLRYVAPAILVIGLLFWLGSFLAGDRSNSPAVAAPPPTLTASPERSDDPTYEAVIEELRATVGERDEPAESVTPPEG